MDHLLESSAFVGILDRHPRGLVVRELRAEVEEVRRNIADGVLRDDIEDTRGYADAVERRLVEATTPSLRPVVNGTGVVLHTNLGRAPLAAAAWQAMRAVAVGYSNLEYDLEGGRRGSRYDHCTALLRELTGAEGALVVNNGAAALVLALATIAPAKGVLVSRGELVEIGGGFRIPEILESSGAHLKEVGSTNRTRISDYRKAASGGDVAMILKVHRSNFRITGFTEEASLAELVGLGAEIGARVAHDLGSGLMVDAALLGLPVEPRPVDSLRAGVDLVAFSGDKLLGGPQAGILLGSEELIDRMRRNPLCRALRVDKTTLAGLEATLRLYRDPETAVREIPTLAMLSADPEGLRERATRLAEAVRTEGLQIEVAEVASVVGGGTFPGIELPSWAVRVIPATGGPDELAASLRSAVTPLVGRVEDGAFYVDMRTVLPAEDPDVLRLLVGHGRR